MTKEIQWLIKILINVENADSKAIVKKKIFNYFFILKIFLINRMHGLFEGQKPFIPTKNPNKCKKCRFQSYCEEKAI